MPDATLHAMETSAEGMDKRHHPIVLEKAKGCFVPKETDSSEINQFQAISLLSVEGKIFFSVLAKRIHGEEQIC